MIPMLTYMDLYQKTIKFNTWNVWWYVGSYWIWNWMRYMGDYYGQNQIHISSTELTITVNDIDTIIPLLTPLVDGQQLTIIILYDNPTSATLLLNDVEYIIPYDNTNETQVECITNGIIDELYTWDRILTRDECTRLLTEYYPFI